MGIKLNGKAVPTAIIALALSAALVACSGAPPPVAAAYEEDRDSRSDGLFTESEAAPSLGFLPSPSPAAKSSEASSRGEATGGAPAGAWEDAYAPPSSSGLKAGFSDDNEQYNYFLGFLDEYGYVPHRELDVSGRVTLEVSDADGKAVANAIVTVRIDGKVVDRGVTLPDGRFRLYPAAYGGADGWDVSVESDSGDWAGTVKADGPRSVAAALPSPRNVPSPLPLDVLFVMDTTGSMGGEIERLKATIEIIHDNIASISPRPAVRFGMVLYKDEGDEYVTRVVPFTEDLESFRKSLALVHASGGGDYPEDLEAALEDAVTRMRWNDDGVRLAFVVTDATAQLGYKRDFDYVSSMRRAREKGIKFHTIGTGGLDVDGEYVLRQISHYSGGRYIFLTYGERGESEGGVEGSVSHHTGSNFTADKLETIVIRFVKEDLSALSDVPVEAKDDDYFEAKRIEAETKDATLGKLFGEALSNLVDYSTVRIGADTPVAILPATASDGKLAANAEYFSERILLAASERRLFTIVDRANLQKILEELELQLSGLVDESAAARVGGLLGAEVLVVGSLVERDGRFEVFLKLVRVGTAEVLAVTRARIEPELGL
ncbi:MAG: VWA domain-containing protein [Spirochaetales bacterium]|nr:VWA domain-containing protein [Spirochaetales bacterium]